MEPQDEGRCGSRRPTGAPRGRRARAGTRRGPRSAAPRRGRPHGPRPARRDGSLDRRGREGRALNGRTAPGGVAATSSGAPAPPGPQAAPKQGADGVIAVDAMVDKRRKADFRGLRERPKPRNGPRFPEPSARRVDRRGALGPCGCPPSERPRETSVPRRGSTRPGLAPALAMFSTAASDTDSGLVALPLGLPACQVTAAALVGPFFTLLRPVAASERSRRADPRRVGLGMEPDRRPRPPTRCPWRPGWASRSAEDPFSAAPGGLHIDGSDRRAR